MRRVTLLLAVLPLLAAPAARADTILTGSVGSTFGGDLDQSHISYGGALSFVGDGILGFEVEGAYTPHFFGNDPNIDSSNAATLMGNLLLATPTGHSFRLYATGGVGIMKFKVTDFDPTFDVDQNDFAMNAGAGVFLGFGGPLGVRGDIRYFRDLQTRTDDITKVDFGKVDFWRGSVGLTLRF
jgi:opacity protein-like surface antigen